MKRVIVITGASSGIGQQLYIQAKLNGDIPVSLSRSNGASHENFIECDVSNEGSVIKAAQEVHQKFGRVDILVNNAGKGISGASELLETSLVKEVVDTDYFGTLYASKHFLPILSEKGKIVNISSACAIFALPFRSVYCSAKAAVNMLSFGQRMELKNTGIKVVCICPGDIKSSFTKNRIKQFQTNERYGDRIQLAADKIDSKEHKRMDVVKASKKIFKIVSRKNKAMYIVGAKYKVLYFFKRILPTNLFIKLTGRFFG